MTKVLKVCKTCILYSYYFENLIFCKSLNIDKYLKNMFKKLIVVKIIKILKKFKKFDDLQKIFKNQYCVNN